MTELPEDELTKIHGWYDLVSGKNFFRLVEHLESLIRSIDSEVEECNRAQSLDNSIKLTVLLSRKKDYQNLLGKFKRIPSEKIAMEAKLASDKVSKAINGGHYG